MLNSNQTSPSIDILIKLKAMLEKDPDLYFGRIKQFFHFSNDFKTSIDEFARYINAGYVPVIYSNHQSHADGVIHSIVIEQTRKLVSANVLKGFLCPVAASMATGDQNFMVQGNTLIFQPIFDKIGFIYVPIIREDDRRKYGMTGSNREAIEKLINAPADKYGMAIFPEGTVQGGRAKQNGHIYGMQKVEGGGILLRCIKFWQDQGRKIVLLPIGIANSYKIFNPDSYGIPVTLTEVIEGAGEISQIVEAIAGKSFTDESMSQELGNNLDPKKQEHIDYLMKKVAVLLPDEARGYYG